MSPTSSLANSDTLIETSHFEQRVHCRYPIKLDLQYKLPGSRDSNTSGFGRVLNISSGGVFFECKQSLPLRVPINLILKWPVLLDGVCPLKLLVRGHVIRSDPAGVAVRIVSYDFRTSKRPAVRVVAAHQ